MRILFQGDSITDAFRDRSNDVGVGVGYPLLVKAALCFENPGQYECINRGISGNRIVDLYARMKTDILHVAPDVISILIGVNDVWHELAPVPNGVGADKFYKIYAMLIEEIKEALPQTKIMILEPFVLKAEATEGAWDYFNTEVKKRADMAKQIANRYGLVFVPLQEGLDRLCESAPASYWLADGVHPTAAGHAFIKNEWLRAFEQYK